jgi:glycosyltransferase 2 family protein
MRWRWKIFMMKYAKWLKIVVAAALLYALLKTDTINFRDFPSIRDNSRLFFVAFLCLLGGILLSALRCAILLRTSGIPIKMMTVMRIQMIGALFSTVLPGAAGGDAVRAVYLFRLLPSHRTTGLLILAMDRLFSLVGLVVLTGIFLWTNSAQVESNATLARYIQFVNDALIILAFTCVITCLAAMYLKIPALSQQLERWRPQLRQIRATVIFFSRQWVCLLGCMALSVLASFVVIMGMVAISKAFTFSPDIYVISLAGILGNISSAIPLTPGGIGIGEAVFAKVCYDLTARMAPYATIYLVFRMMMALVSLPGLWIYLTFDLSANTANTTPANNDV